jgi:transcription initiation factor TFIIIB Brf1 subunit/transcription initiation factor TFIIB
MSFSGRTSGILCPKCGADLAEFSITDYTHGETACGNCGSVLEDHLIDSGAEWRTFEDSTDDPARASKTDPYLAMTTDIGTGGSRGSGSLRSHHYQLLNQDVRQRNLKTAFSRFYEFTDKLDLPAHVIDAAKDIYTKFETNREKSSMKGGKKDAAILAVLWEACRVQRGPSDAGRTLKEFAKETGIEEGSIKKAYKKIKKVLKKSQQTPLPPSSSSSVSSSSSSLSHEPSSPLHRASSHNGQAGDFPEASPHSPIHRRPSSSPPSSPSSSSPAPLFPPPKSPARLRLSSSSSSSLPLPPPPSTTNFAPTPTPAPSIPTPSPAPKPSSTPLAPSQISRQVEQLVETFGQRLGLPFKFIMTARKLGIKVLDLGEGKHPSSLAAYCIKFASEHGKLLPAGMKVPTLKELSAVADVSTTTLRNVTKSLVDHETELELILNPV